MSPEYISTTHGTKLPQSNTFAKCVPSVCNLNETQKNGFWKIALCAQSKNVYHK